MNSKMTALLLSGCIGLTAAECLVSHAGMNQYSSWDDPYKNILLDFKESAAYNPPDSSDDTLCSMFDLKDITGDGVPELILSEGGYHPSMVEIYTYLDGTAHKMLKAGSFGVLSYNNDPTHDGIYIIDSDMNQGVMNYTAYVCNNKGVSYDRTFTVNESAAYDGGEVIYLINSETVTKEEYDEAFSKYKNIKLTPTERKYRIDVITEQTDLESYYSPDRTLLGDVNSDNIIDGMDASGILTAYAKSSVEGGDTGFNEKQKYAADVNFDGIIDGIDATLVLTYYAKTSVGYPGELEDFIKGRIFSGDEFTYGLESGTDAINLLEGRWDMLPGGLPTVLAPAPFSLSFNSDAPSFTITQSGSERKISSVIEFYDLFGSPRGCYNLIRTIPDAEMILNDNKERITFDQPFDTMFTAAYVNGLPVICLRTIGNGISPLEMMFNGDYGTSTNGWVFAKHTNEDIKPVDETKMAELRVKGGTFYAFRWLDTGSEVYLQEVTTAITEKTYEDGKPRDMMFYTYKDNGHALTAVRYHIKGAEEFAHSGCYRPGLVKVTTDQNGNITDIIELQELAYGYYTPQ